MRVAWRACRTAFVTDSWGDAVDRGADQRAQTVDVAGQLHVDAWSVAGTAGQPLQVGDASLWRELGLVAVAQRPDQRPQVG
jgi:hypothetical protein